MDTQGPSIRTGELTESIPLKPGDPFVFTVRGEKYVGEPSTSVNYEFLAEDLSVGTVILVDNGVLRMLVIEKFETRLHCKVLTEGVMGSRRHINLPGIRVRLPSITEKDFLDIRWGVENGIDSVALSFVRTAGDIEQLREFLKSLDSKIRIIAKIEDQQAVENLKEIIQVADGIMIARGDLGIELPFQELPITQRKIVKQCIQKGRPVIVATHLLESMHENPVPTRAEVTDVSNIVYEQADAMMLTGETGVGRYPLKCIETLDIVSRRIERSGGAGFSEGCEFSNDRERLMASAVVLANSVKASGILVFTRRGYSAQMISRLRPRPSHIYAFTPGEMIWRQMATLWGVRAFRMDLDHEDPEMTVKTAFQILKQESSIQPGEVMVLVTQVEAHGDYYDTVQLRKVF
jgi:pyruvate kinase